MTGLVNIKNTVRTVLNFHVQLNHDMLNELNLHGSIMSNILAWEQEEESDRLEQEQVHSKRRRLTADPDNSF